MDGWDVFWTVIFYILVCIAIIAILYAAYQWIKFFVQHFNGQENNRPLNIAKERYARGEITKEELEEIKINLA